MRPVVLRQEVREYTYVYLATCLQNGATTPLILPYANTECMDLFLREISERYPDNRGILALDGAGWHTTPELEEFDNVRLLFLPAYSPELNPAEHLWRFLRERHIKNTFWNTLDELIDKLVMVLHDLVAPNDTIRSLAGFHWAIL